MNLKGVQNNFSIYIYATKNYVTMQDSCFRPTWINWCYVFQKKAQREKVYVNQIYWHTGGRVYHITVQSVIKLASHTFQLYSYVLK